MDADTEESCTTYNVLKVCDCGCAVNIDCSLKLQKCTDGIQPAPFLYATSVRFHVHALSLSLPRALCPRCAQVARHLYTWTANSTFFDFFDRALWNGLIGNQARMLTRPLNIPLPPHTLTHRSYTPP
jgi:hypothetical protein